MNGRPYWKPEYSVQVRELDEQHKQLFALIGELYDAVNDPERDISKKVLTALRDYAISHFSTEERIMLRYKYDGYNEQKKEHDAFFDELHKYEKKSDASVLEIMTFLEGWLSVHILKVDKKYAAFFNLHGIK